MKNIVIYQTKHGMDNVTDHPSISGVIGLFNEDSNNYFFYLIIEIGD